MSYKDGIPLLHTHDDGGDSDDDFTVETTGEGSRCHVHCTKKHFCFGGVLVFAIVAVIALVVSATVLAILFTSEGEKTTLAKRTSVPALTPNQTVTHYPNQTQLPIPTPTPTPSASQVHQGKMDTREYEVITMVNDLQVLLISDPDSNISAASMDVGVGSFSDPREVQGLAHFCEHMLFLGTEKYPDEHIYSNFLQTHGGYDNAFTSTQETNYYFNVEADFLVEALDMFAQFFIAPLFTESAVDREMNAVNSEHEKNLQSDEWRVWQLLKHISNPAHPFSQFSTGTNDTLNKTNISDYLHDFYMSYYSSNQMKLVIYGRQPIQTLKQWASNSFSDIPNRHIATPTFSTTSFPPGYSGKLVYYYPVADTNSLYIYWQTSPLEKKYRNDVSNFISRYIGDKGHGGIIEFLREENYADALSAGTEVDTDSYTLFYVNIDLTSNGLSHVSEVILTVFQYIRLLLADSDQLGMLWDDFVNVTQPNFDYAIKDEPSDYAVDIASTMRVVEDPADFLGNPARYILDSSLVMETLNTLTPEKAVILIGSHQLNVTGSPPLPPFTQVGPVPVPWPVLTEEEPIYGTHYQLMDTPQKQLLDYWNTDNHDWDDKFSLPGPNQFIPCDFEILPPPQDAPTDPKEVDMTQEGVSLWWLQDREFNEPRVYLHCHITTINTDFCPRYTALTDLYVSQVMTVLQPVLAPAFEAGYSYSFNRLPNGLSLNLDGFSDPMILEKFVEIVASGLHDQTQLLDFALFQLVQDSLMDDLKNYNYTTLPYRYIRQYLQNVVMERPYWKHYQRLEEVQNSTLEDVLDHALNSLLSDSTVLCFAHGNLNQEQAINYTSIISGAISSLRGEPAVGSFSRKRVDLSPGNYSVTLQALNPQDLNSVINIGFQVSSVCDLEVAGDGTSSCSRESLRTAVHLGLLDQIIGDQCFYQLRTIEQLGYVVWCYSTSNMGIGSFQSVVQSVWASPAYLLERIDLFLHSFSEDLAVMNDRDFSGFVDVYKSTLLRKELTLSDESYRLWSEINSGLVQFDYNDQKIDILDTVNVSTLFEFYNNHILDLSKAKKMVIAVHGEDDSGEIPNIVYPLDYQQLNQTVTHYPYQTQLPSTTTLPTTGLPVPMTTALRMPVATSTPPVTTSTLPETSGVAATTTLLVPTSTPPVTSGVAATTTLPVPTTTSGVAATTTLPITTATVRMSQALNPSPSQSTVSS